MCFNFRNLLILHIDWRMNRSGKFAGKEKRVSLSRVEIHKPGVSPVRNSTKVFLQTNCCCNWIVNKNVKTSIVSKKSYVCSNVIYNVTDIKKK